MLRVGGAIVIVFDVRHDRVIFPLQQLQHFLDGNPPAPTDLPRCPRCPSRMHHGNPGVLFGDEWTGRTAEELADIEIDSGERRYRERFPKRLRAGELVGIGSVGGRRHLHAVLHQRPAVWPPSEWWTWRFAPHPMLSP